MENKCTQIEFGVHARTLKNENKVILGNVLNGLWIKCSDYIYEFLLNSIVEKRTVDEIIDECLDTESKKYMTDLIETLIKIEVLTISSNLRKENIIKHITLELTTRCNLRCIHCCADCGEEIRKDMDFNKIQEIIEWSQKNNIESISLTGGEIFLRTDIWEILEYIRKNFHGDVEILTNGTLIKNEKIAYLLTLVDCISISLDGYDEESVTKIRGKGVFNKVLEKINLLRKNKFENVSLSMVVTEETSNSIKAFKDLCSMLGVRPVTRVFTPEGRGKDNYIILNPSYKNSLERDFDESTIDKLQNEVNFRCICNMESKVFICADGNIYSCFLEIKSGNILGDIDDLLSSKLERAMVLPIVDSINPCSTCNVRYFCASSCPGHNSAIFNDEKLRKELCSSSIEYYKRIVWN
ncbi:radical SAM/SPASM domain-containing protein [Paenibacillus alvei]|uniref:Radical SAM protein n=1 Tax=Paenibacillus alvei TaxID=44250 RepID=A0AAP7A4D6_PAEAL|nr:radical SAM protein [Paenibacillus alvei]NOJ73111.1 radical SAM protein [Paenibacillus alvei]